MALKSIGAATLRAERELSFSWSWIFPQLQILLQNIMQEHVIRRVGVSLDTPGGCATSELENGVTS